MKTPTPSSTAAPIITHRLPPQPVGHFGMRRLSRTHFGWKQDRSEDWQDQGRFRQARSSLPYFTEARVHVHFNHLTESILSTIVYLVVLVGRNAERVSRQQLWTINNVAAALCLATSVVFWFWFFVIGTHTGVYHYHAFEAQRKKCNLHPTRSSF